MINADGSGLQRLTAEPGEEINPAWSPDGTKIAFSGHSDDAWDIYVVDVESGAVSQLTDDPAADVEPSWRLG